MRMEPKNSPLNEPTLLLVPLPWKQLVVSVSKEDKFS